MNRWKALFSACMAVLLLFVNLGEMEAAEKKDGLAKILMVPLDDRPANLYFPQQVGKAAGVEVITPPNDMIGFYTEPGNGKEISKWLLDNAEEADGFVISASMLAYGGLIASRTGVKSEEEALSDIQVIKKLKELYPEKPVYVYDTIQRLAVTAISEEYLKYYDQIRRWAILYDQVINLGMEEYRAEFEKLESEIPESVLQDYLNARARNHSINKLLIDWVNNGSIDYLILAQDDAAPHGLHRAEREILVEKVTEYGLEDQVSVFPGADEVDVVLVSRFVTQLFNTEPSFYIEYGGIHGKDWIAPFEDTTFDYNVIKHITASGGKIAEDEKAADIHLLLNTPSSDKNNRTIDVEKMVNRTSDLIKAGKQVAIGDVIEVNRADALLISQLTEKIDLTKLLAYSGWNTAGNTIGITIGHAAARTAFLEQTSGFGVPLYEDTAEAHYEFLLHRFSKDHSYKNIVHPAARAYIFSIGASEWGLGEDYDLVNQFVHDQLTLETQKWFEHFEGKHVYIGKRGNKKFYRTINSLESVHVKLPWPRIFEAELEPEVNLK
ncbi:DUF4127 family protein [Cytobacillus firmus]|uniref:DUF4127 family protein n=1 Tax=Cytobacillus firmus TaxID=1399 RepID=UPI0024C1F4D9|nr:DUF4127 family protein [Cytobacillus firmus]WHY61480.1 DUF4127 family protein [Cytobacillus firmus]